MFKVVCEKCKFWTRHENTNVGKCSSEKTVENFKSSEPKVKKRGRPPKVKPQKFPKGSSEMLIGIGDIYTGSDFGCRNFEENKE